MQSTIFVGEVASKTESGMGVIAGTEQNPVLMFVKPMSDNSRSSMAAAQEGDRVLVSGEVIEAKIGKESPYYVIEAYQILDVKAPGAFNKFMLTGRLGKQPVLRHTGNNNPVTNLNVAVKTGQETVWVQLTAWGRQAETAAEFLYKGSLITATGVLKAPKPWGNPPRANIEATVFYIEFLSPPRRQQDEVMEPENFTDINEIPF